MFIFFCNCKLNKINVCFHIYCEEHPAEIFCKTCPGHLCEKCKTKQKKRNDQKTSDCFF